MNYKTVFQKTGLLAISILFAFVLAESVLRIFYPTQLHYYVWPPHLRHAFTPDTTILSGISTHSLFTINSYGVRTGGGNFNREMNILQKPADKNVTGNRYCLCLGGSTTECLYLDDSKTWEAQIAWHALAASDTTIKFIGNIGKSGCTSTDNYIHLKYSVPQYKKITTVILMVGINDMLKRLSRDTLFQNNFELTETSEDSLVNVIFGLEANKAFWKRTTLFHMFQNIYHSIDKRNQDDTAEIYTEWRLRRQRAPAFVDTLPDLVPALTAFGNNINLLIDEAKKLNLEIVFVNQAAFWKDSMTFDEQAKLWMGGIGRFQSEGGHKYYTSGALRKALSLYNQQLAKICSERKIKLIDIDSQLPKTRSVFYDDCHFNENGADMVGNIIYKELKSPF
jgi:lysophospholipase L1-like esterase